jgi:polyisoprenoid-binding protein YceI
MIIAVVLSAVLVASLYLATASAGEAQPCAPFEGGRVDPQLVATMRKAAAEGRLYRVDPDASKVGFCVRHFPFQEFRGEFTNIAGGLAFPPEPAQYGQALLLIHTSSLKSDNPALEPLVKGRHFMDTANYPEILYVGRKFEWLSEVHAHIYGELSVRGRTRPVIFDVDINAIDDVGGERGDRIGLRGLSHVSRFNFDMRSHRFFVSDTIQLCLAVELVRWGSQP